MNLADSATILALNKEVVEVTSPMDLRCFTSLYELSTSPLVAEVESDVVGFIFVVENGQAYENSNYRWFSDNLSSFLYIDRVVVSEACRGLGIGRLLYTKVFDVAQQLGISNICAEMNLEPPNRESLRFHKLAGFNQIGIRTLESGKRVSMQMLTL